jgi:hypothetical protein
MLEVPDDECAGGGDFRVGDRSRLLPVQVPSFGLGHLPFHDVAIGTRPPRGLIAQCGITQRTRPMGGFKSVESAQRFCRVHDEVRNFLRPRSRRNEVVSLAQRRLLYTARTRVLLNSLAAV